MSFLNANFYFFSFFLFLQFQSESDALNNLFQKIYSDSDPDIQRAMNKSFTESGKWHPAKTVWLFLFDQQMLNIHLFPLAIGGTVLSTNWNEVGSGKVEMKPPDGTEYREWEK